MFEFLTRNLKYGLYIFFFGCKLSRLTCMLFLSHTDQTRQRCFSTLWCNCLLKVTWSKFLHFGNIPHTEFWSTVCGVQKWRNLPVAHSRRRAESLTANKHREKISSLVKIRLSVLALGKPHTDTAKKIKAQTKFSGRYKTRTILHEISSNSH